jgi:hypothetical protein
MDFLLRRFIAESPAMISSEKTGRLGNMLAGRARWRAAAAAVAAATAIAGLSAVIAPGPAAAAGVPGPRAGGSYAKTLILNDGGSKLAAWNKSASYCTVSPDYKPTAKVGVSKTGSVTLTTTGTAGSCGALISPGAYSSGVIEASVYFPPLPGKPHTLANWNGVWLAGATWPNDGELDATEVEPVDATNAVTYHSGTSSALFSASTSVYTTTRLPIKTANIKPGWNMVDIVFKKGFFAVYYNGHLYTSFTSSHIVGKPMNIYITNVNTPNTTWVVQHIGSKPINSSSKPASVQVKYLRVWSYK